MSEPDQAFLERCVAIGLTAPQIREAMELTKEVRAVLTPLKYDLYERVGKTTGKKMLAMALQLMAGACNEAVDEDQENQTKE